MNTFHYSQHIRYQKDFQHLFKKGFRIYGNFFVFRVSASADLSKLGVTVSKKFGNAVYRNRMRRIIRESFRVERFSMPLFILVSQTKTFEKETSAKKEIKQVFMLLSDKYYVRQILCGEHVSLRYSQFTRENLSLGAKISFFTIWGYRKFLSKQFPQSCRFTPSCSIYALEALRVYGFWKGWFLISRRLFSCRPGGGSGFDPVPLVRKKKKS